MLQSLNIELSNTMNKDQAYQLFNQMVDVASEELINFTLNSNLNIEHKADKTAVTACDQAIDKKLTEIALKNNLQVVSEEGEHVINIAKSGNYITIDPIDGTLGYIEYVNYALENGGIENFGQEDLGTKSDFCLLVGIVENSKPVFGLVYNYITKEKILISSNKEELIRENETRIYDSAPHFYMDQRIGGQLEKEVSEMNDVTSVVQAALGLKSIYTIVNSHQDAVTIHRVQSAGLWDIMPAAVAARAFDCEVLDDNGDALEFNKYIILPGKGATIIKGNKFQFVKNKLKEIPNLN